MLKMLFAGILPCFIFSATSFAQFIITGKVTDAVSKEPLSNASVFCENTTIGTHTDQSGNFSLLLSPGGYNLIISYTGYKPQRLQVSGTMDKMEIKMLREDKLQEVTIRSKSRLVEEGWNRYGKYFIDNFIGSTPNASGCSLLNPEILRFYYFRENNKIKVFASEPLQISNKTLGYTLSYRLDSFVYYFDNTLYSYQGNCFYTEMEGTEKEKKAWAKNRKDAYFGSVLHFMRSYYKGELRKEGWQVTLQEKDDDTMFDIVSNPFDTAFYTSSKEENGQVEIRFPRKIRIIYLKKAPEPEYLERYGLTSKQTKQSSVVETKGVIAIKENGYYYDPMRWVSYNYWSWKNLADQLPYDYALTE